MLTQFVYANSHLAVVQEEVILSLQTQTEGGGLVHIWELGDSTAKV